MGASTHQHHDGQKHFHRHKDSSKLVDGSRVGNYQIVKTLGEGSFGKVKLAYHSTTGQKVALKIINKKILSKSDMQGRIEREISYLRLLRHPHIIKLYDVIKSKDEIIMVIEYADNELFDYIVQRDKMSENEARRFFQQMISAVEYCHRHKIVHRDLKPENLLLDEHLNVKIADFGLSNIMTDGNFLKTSCGSPNYAAPEVINGKLYAGPEVDVWSCGVILYVMLCRRLPFDDENIPALFKNISNGVYSIPKFLSPGAASLIKRMLIVNPLNRISIHEIMEDEWFKTNLPEYLAAPAPTFVVAAGTTANDQASTNGNLAIDEPSVDILANTMNYGKDEIYEALKSSDNNTTMAEIREAYALIKENQSLISNLKNHQSTRDELDTFLAKSPPSYSSDEKLRHIRSANSSQQQRTYHQPEFNTMVSETNDESTVAILPTSLPQIHRANMVEHGFNVIPPVVTKKSKIKWHFGIRSRSYPLDVMGEIYTALKSLGAKWVTPTEEELWTIKIRWKYDVANEDAPDFMRMVIQLFQIEPNNYLVDMKFDGWETSTGEKIQYTDLTEDEMNTLSAYPFLNLTTKLIMELAVHSQGN